MAKEEVTELKTILDEAGNPVGVEEDKSSGKKTISEPAKPELKRAMASSLHSNPMEGKMHYDDNVRVVLEQSVKMNLPTLLVGETGTGKTSFVRELASIEGKELIRINLTGQTGVDELIGKWLASPSKGTYWIDGLLTDAMRKGIWVVLDEINMALPEILSKLHSLLDDDRKIVLIEKDGEVVRPAPDFRFFATMNPSDEYAGTKELNKAFVSRFPLVMNVEYSDEEVDILMERTGIDLKTATNLVTIAREVRSNKAKDLLTYACSTRDLIACADLIALDMPLELAMEVSILNKASKEERVALRKIIEMITGGKIKMPDGKVYKTIGDLMEEAGNFSKERKELKDEMIKWKDSATEFKKKYEDQQASFVEKTLQLEQVEKKNETLKKKIDNFIDLFDKAKRDER